MATQRPAQTVTLPSIHEMFPEHLLQLSDQRVQKATDDQRQSIHCGVHSHGLEQRNICDFSRRSRLSSRGDFQPLVQDKTEYPSTLDNAHSFDQHLPHHPLSLYCHPSLYSSSPQETTAMREEERRHICPHCEKRFNRPSSLAIHINTHTGAKPFECPFPGCGRKFNVNSNMRRHLRNHTSSSRSPIHSPLLSPLSMTQRSPIQSTVSSTNFIHTKNALSRPPHSPSTSSNCKLSDIDYDEASSPRGTTEPMDTDSETEDASYRLSRFRLRSCSSPDEPYGGNPKVSKGCRMSRGRSSSFNLSRRRYV